MLKYQNVLISDAQKFRFKTYLQQAYADIVTIQNPEKYWDPHEIVMQQCFSFILYISGINYSVSFESLFQIKLCYFKLFHIKCCGKYLFNGFFDAAQLFLSCSLTQRKI